MSESNTKQCEKKSTWSPDQTILQKLKTFKDELQRISPSNATKNFQTDITMIEQEYNALPNIVAEYDVAYLTYKPSGSLYGTAEDQWNEIKKWESNSALTDKIKQAIKKLREETYCDGTEEHLKETHPKIILEKSKQDFRSLKSCYEQRQEEDVDILAQYGKEKAFKKTADGWFADLKDLHLQAKTSNDKKKYGSLHAIYLEAEQVWQKITGLTSETPAALKKKLTDRLWKALQAKDERFRWHQDWLDKEQDVTNAQTNYNTFNTNRRKDFIREAEDVEATNSY